MMRQTLPLVTFALVTVLVSCGQRGETPVDKLISVGTHRLHLSCTGSGRPVVVIDVGMGEPSTS